MSTVCDPHRAAQKIRRYRQQNGQTQSEFAALFAVNRVQVFRWEKGHARPAAAVQERLHALGVCEPNDWFAAPLAEQQVAA